MKSSSPKKCRRMLGPKLLLLIRSTSRIFACKGTPSSQSDIDGLLFCCSLIQCLSLVRVSRQPRQGWNLGNSHSLRQRRNVFGIRLHGNGAFPAVVAFFGFVAQSVDNISPTFFSPAWRLVFADSIRGACYLLLGCELARPPISVVWFVDPQEDGNFVFLVPLDYGSPQLGVWFQRGHGRLCGLGVCCGMCGSFRFERSSRSHQRSLESVVPGPLWYRMRHCSSPGLCMHHILRDGGLSGGVLFVVRDWTRLLC